MSAINKYFFGGLFAVTAFAATSAVDTATASAHCGGHSGSCGTTVEYNGQWCEYSNAHRMEGYTEYYNDCSGTCYNGGTAGCCSSPAECESAPCKPGGCGGACGYAGGWENDLGYDPSCGI